MKYVKKYVELENEDFRTESINYEFNFVTNDYESDDNAVSILEISEILEAARTDLTAADFKSLVALCNLMFDDEANIYEADCDMITAAAADLIDFSSDEFMRLLRTDVRELFKVMLES